MQPINLALALFEYDGVYNDDDDQFFNAFTFGGAEDGFSFPTTPNGVLSTNQVTVVTNHAIIIISTSHLLPSTSISSSLRYRRLAQHWLPLHHLHLLRLAVLHHHLLHHLRPPLLLEVLMELVVLTPLPR